MDTELALQLIISQKLITDPIDVASSSNYQSNCIILEILRRASHPQLQEFLQASQGPLHDTVLVEGKDIVIGGVYMQQCIM